MALVTVGGLVILVGIGACFAAEGEVTDPDENEARTARGGLPTNPTATPWSWPPTVTANPPPTSTTRPTSTPTPRPTVIPRVVRLAKKHDELIDEYNALAEEATGLIEAEDFDRLCANIGDFRSRQLKINATMVAVERGLWGRPDPDNTDNRNKKEEAFAELAARCKLLTASSTPTPTPRPRPKPIVTPADSAPTPAPRRNLASIGQISVRTSTGEGHGGTGFVIGTDGPRAFVVTNHHVVEDAEVMVLSLGGQRYEDVTLLGSHEHEDVAVLSVCCALFTPLSSSTMPVTPGTEVVAVGMPLQSGEIIRSQGKVLRLTQRYGSSSPVIEHTAELHPGSSGGPLLNADGKVIGINSGSNVKDATKFIATNYASVKSLIARWTGQVVSEADVAPAEPSMWVILVGGVRSDGSPEFEVFVDTEFDFTDEGGLEVFVDGETHIEFVRIYADEGRYRFGTQRDTEHPDVARVSVQTDGGFDMRCQKDGDLSNERETVFACIWR